MAYNQSAVIGLGQYDRGSEDIAGVEFHRNDKMNLVTLDLTWIFAGDRQGTGQHAMHLTGLNETQARKIAGDLDEAAQGAWAWINDKWGESS